MYMLFSMNKFNMEAILKIPKILEHVEDITKHQVTEKAFQSYKQNVKSFIQMISKQMIELIQKYQNQISRLNNENKALKRSKDNPETIHTSPTLFRATESPIKSFGSTVVSPIKSFNLINTAQSNFISSDMYKVNKGLSSDELRFQSQQLKRDKVDDYQFPQELIRNSSPKTLNKSRFQANSLNKKRREGDLIQYLQSTKKNLDRNADKFFSIVGKTQAQTMSDANGVQNQNNSADSSKSQKQQELNSSLGSICNSLDNSFISKKSRSQRQKRANAEEDLKKKKKEKEEELNKMTKQRGLMSLLKRLRDNVETSPHKSPQIIKQSKLISCGSKQVSPKNKEISSPMKKGSKVMINPVPVDIIKKNQSIQGKSQVNTQQKKPQSILKQTSTILTRSLSGISAIEYSD